MNISSNQFAGFIDKLIQSGAQGSDWNEYAVNHFQDTILEDVRKDVVRLMIEATDSDGRIRPDTLSTTRTTLQALKQRLEKKK